MADENTTKAVFDLDAKEALQQMLKLKGHVSELGEQNLEGLISGLTKVGAAAGAIGAAYFALKTTLETVFEAENIKAVNQQFEILTKNAGISGEALRSMLTESANGMIDDTSLMKAANKAIIEMGATAKSIPQVMDLARKSTAAFGGDLVSNFESINQAIATGNMRAIKQMGIIVDAKKAYDDYARSIGVAANSLSDQGRQQALLNAILEKGESAFKGVDVNIRQAENSFQQIKATLETVKETFVLAFDKTMGPSVRSFLSNIKDASTDFKNFVQSHLGDESEKAAAHVSQIERKIQDVNHSISDLEARKGIIPSLFPASADAAIVGLREQLTALEAQLDEARAKAGGGEEAAPAGGAPSTPGVDPEVAKANEAKFQQDIAQIKQEAMQQELLMVDNLAQYEQMKEQEKLNTVQQFEAQKQAILTATNLTAVQKSAEIEQVENLKHAKIRALETQTLEHRLKVLENYKQNYISAMDGLARGFAGTAQQQMLMMNDWGKTGERVYGSLKQHATDAFVAIGDGSKSAGDAMLGMVLSTIADEAIARGSVMMMSGIFPPNPLALGAGAALVAFGGLLKGKAAGLGASHGGVSPASMPATAAESSSSPEVPDLQKSSLDRNTAALERKTDQDALAMSPEKEPEDTVAPRKTVNIQIAGNYFETEQTRQRLMEMIREATDATDFRYEQIGEVRRA